MTDTPSHLRSDYFDGMYARSDDPWGFLTRWYEQRKRAVTVAALARPRYATALEVGCSIGVLTEQLAERCDELLAVDLSAAAVTQARGRVGDRLRDRARIEVVDVGESFPPGPFELIVLSEVGYYFSAEKLAAVLASAVAALAPGGELLACHWRHPVADYPLSGDEVHEALAALGLPRLVRHLEEDFVLEVFSSDRRSVARREGLA
jgi:SAM-dependent methyltransferase